MQSGDGYSGVPLASASLAKCRAHAGLLDPGPQPGCDERRLSVLLRSFWCAIVSGT